MGTTGAFAFVMRSSESELESDPELLELELELFEATRRALGMERLRSAIVDELKAMTDSGFVRSAFAFAAGALTV
jgi:hypothetical protein